MRRSTWIIVIGLLIAAGIFAAIYQTRIKHYTLPNGEPAQRPAGQ